MVEYPVHTRSVTCSSQVAATRPVGQAVKTPPFHGGNMGSIPVRVTKKERHPFGCLSFLCLEGIESSKCNSPVDCCRRRLDGAEPLFSLTAKMQTIPYGSLFFTRRDSRFFGAQSARTVKRRRKQIVQSYHSIPSGVVSFSRTGHHFPHFILAIFPFL